jgi:hypothetical protein
MGCRKRTQEDCGVTTCKVAIDTIDLNSEDAICNRTPLAWAAREGHKEIVELLPQAMDN